MYQDGCYGCTQSFLWPNYRTSAYPRKPNSFHIMDILHIRPEHQVPSALGPLQDFCRTKSVQNIVTPSVERVQTLETEKDLKFGINRILSEEFGTQKSMTRESKNKYSVTCDCGSPSCGVFMFSQISSQPFHSSHYTLCHTETETLPGPYSILNDETCSAGQAKRKRSWSRAVFSNLQRKGLEKRFEVQKYVTKPDRRQLAAMLGLTDAQDDDEQNKNKQNRSGRYLKIKKVKVWFQNRRMKWRHMQQMRDKELAEQKKESDDQSDKGNDIEGNADSDQDL